MSNPGEETGQAVPRENRSSYPIYGMLVLKTFDKTMFVIVRIFQKHFKHEINIKTGFEIEVQLFLKIDFLPLEKTNKRDPLFG